MWLNMKTKILLAGSLLLLFLVLGCAQEQAKYPTGNYNLIIISLDTVRADHLGVYGYNINTTPFLDSIADKAIVFEQAFAQSSWTAPSHASFFTSYYPSVINFSIVERLGDSEDFEHIGVIPSELKTLAEYLQEQDYYTFAVTDGGFVSRSYGFNRGFDKYNEYIQKDILEGAGGFTANMPYTLKKLESVSTKKDPFFLFLHTYDAHEYNKSLPHAQEFAGKYKSNLSNDSKLTRHVQSYLNEDFRNSLTEEDLNYMKGLYDGAIRFIDDNLEIMFNKLEELELMDNTIIVIFSDHGEQFMEHKRTGHGYSLFDEELHVPLMIFHPDIEGRRISTQVSLIDVMPTLLDFVNISYEGLFGTSLIDTLNGTQRDDPTFAEWGHFPWESVRTPSYKYILRDDGFTYLFDLRINPEETQNLHNQQPKQLFIYNNTMNEWRKTNRAVQVTRTDPKEKISDEALEQLRSLGYVA